MTSWKYTKGSEKDFDGAPNDCLLIIKSKSKYNDMTYKLSGDYSFVDIERCGGVIIAQRQPVTEWEGEGFPPVGVECEILNKVNKRWYPVKICFIDGNNMAWIESNGGVIDCTGSAYLKEFRPINSESERRRDESVKKILTHLNETDSFNMSNYDSAASLFDAIAAGKIPHVRLEG